MDEQELRAQPQGVILSETCFGIRGLVRFLAALREKVVGFLWYDKFLIKDNRLRRLVQALCLRLR